MSARGRAAAANVLRFALLALAGASVSLQANPTEGAVASGSATITSIPGVVTVDQLTDKAVINWQTFSIGAGELTKFVQPSSASATLNRVLGGQMSVINGTLSANGQVYLLNGNGLLIGPTGVVNTAGFLGSTRALTDEDFAAGKLHFVGRDGAGVANLGKISALGGDVILIGKTVDNRGEITAPAGHVGLAAGDEVMISQAGLEHVFVRSTANATDASGQTAVNNSGNILAATAELKAANGNIYALATNNSGIIRATGVVNEKGHIWLIADRNLGVTQNTGSLIARGADGTGGAIETSGGRVVTHGTVDAGPGGTWLIDPSDITIDALAATALVTSLNAGTNVTEDSSLGVGGSGDITVSSPISWTGTGTLNLYAYRNLAINDAITAGNGSLAVKSALSGTGTISASAAIAVKSFALQGGSWIQNADTLPGHVLPGFAATDFNVAGGAFLRVLGGAGTGADPYQLSDVFGLQGIGSAANHRSSSWRVSTPIDASGTSAWNSGAGFIPIGTFTGNFNGNGAAISGLVINAPGATNVGLFAQIGAAGRVTNTIFSNAQITGLANVGTLAGSNAGSISTMSASGSVTGVNNASSFAIGGMVGVNTGAVSNSFVTSAITGYGNTGGLVGSNSGTITSSYSTGNVSSFSNGVLSGSNLGGLVGLNSGGVITLAYTTGNVNAADSAQVGGLVGASTGGTAIIQESQARGSHVTGYSQVGGLVGSNGAAASILGGKLTDGVGQAAVVGTQEVGGLVGNNAGLITQSSARSLGSVAGQDGFATAGHLGGLVGTNSGSVTNSFASIVVTQVSGTTDAEWVGGLIGLNTASGGLVGIYSSGNVTGLNFVGGLVGENAGVLGVQSTASGIVTGNDSVGGLLGKNTGTVGNQSFATGTVSGRFEVGGLVGSNNTVIAVANVYAAGNVSGTSKVGGLIGANAAGNFTASNATGNVSGSITSIGGLIGQNAGIITLGHATGNVSAASADSVGGLVGDNSGQVISGSNGGQSFASGTVIGHSGVGGLVGTNSGSVGDPFPRVAALADYTHATGAVTGFSLVGGLIGDNSGTVLQTWASGLVRGSSTTSSMLGGLAGRNASGGSISTSFSTSSVFGNGTASTDGAASDTDVGGLVGANLGTISGSYATGVVVGDNNIGGLVGLNNHASAVVQTSYATGSVTGLTATGGLVGFNQLGTVGQSYSTSAVVGTTNVGGLVGLNAASVLQNYATGTVDGSLNVGGLVGQIAPGGTLAESYATGAVTGTSVAGGLVGLNSGSVSNSYWDQDSTTRGVVGIGSDVANTGATGLTSLAGSPTAFLSASYSGLGTTGAVAGGAANAVQFTAALPQVAWYMLESSTRPFLAWEAPINNLQVGSAYLVYTAHQLQLLSVNLGSPYILGSGISLAETQLGSGMWNTAKGFVPIGTAASPFSGSLSGASFGISSLLINAPAVSGVGLFGASTGSLSGISLSGNVTGLNQVGLLVGLNAGTVTSTRVSGTATGVSKVGGLVGENQNLIQSSVTNVTTTGNNQVGGVAGFNAGAGTIQKTYARSAVSGTGASQSALGGLVGLNSGTITIAYAMGAVAGNASSSNVGGAVGRDTGSVNQTYATGVVSGGSQVGGLVGSLGSGATVTQSYATGAVTGTGSVGGLAGSLESGAALTRSYASGLVTGTTNVGGLLGAVAAGATQSGLYWDDSNATLAIGSDQSVGQGAITNLHGITVGPVTTASYANFDSGAGFTAGFGSSALVFGSADSIWRIQTGSEFPLLTALSTQLSGTAYTTKVHTTPAAGATVTLNSGGNLLASTTSDGLGAFSFLAAADHVLITYLPQTNSTLRISDTAHNADSIAAKLYSGSGVPDLLANVTAADTWGDTVRVVSSNLNNTLLTQAGSAFISNAGNNPFGGTNITIAENFDVGSVAGSYSINGDITANGDVTFDAAGIVPTDYENIVTLHANSSAGNPTPSFTLNASLSSGASNRAITVQSEGSFVNNVGLGAFSTPNGTWLVYSQNSPGSGQPVEDTTNGLNQHHLYGTNYTETPAYLLSPGQNYQIYTFVPTLTLTAVAVGATAGTLNVEYGTSTPGLTYTVSGLLPGDTVTQGETFNQVLSNQPGEQTTYAKWSPLGNYPVSFTGSTLPSSLIGYNLAFAAGTIAVTQSTSLVDISVSGSQSFGYIGGGPTFAFSATGYVAGDPNFLPTFTTTVGQFGNVLHDGGGAVVPHAGTIGLNAGSISNYSNVNLTPTDLGFTVTPAALTVTAAGTSIYGNSIVTPTLASNSTAGAGVVYDLSGTGSTVSINTLGYTTNPTVTTATHVGSYAFGVAGTTGNAPSGVLGNYTVTIDPGTYVITQRQLLINGSQNETKSYDGDASPTTFGATDYAIGSTSAGTGLVNGDVVTGLMGRVNPTNASINHYNYTVGTLGTADSGAVANSDYLISFNHQGFGLDITPRLITIGILQDNTKVYGAADPSTNLFANGFFAITSGSLASGENFATAGRLGRQAGEAVNGGTPYLFTSMGTVGIINGSAASTTGNYAITFSNASAFGLTVTPAPLTVTASNDARTYSGVGYAGGNGVTYAGFKFSDNAASLGGTLAYSGNSQGAINVGAYTLTPGGYTSGNYTIGYANGTLTINRAALTITANNDVRTYDATAYSGGNGVIFAGFQNSEDASALGGALGYAGTAQGAINAGSYTITPGGYTSGNYTIGFVNGTLTVNQAALTVTADDQAKIYGGVDPTLTFTPTGTLFGADGYGVISGVSLVTTTGAAATAGTHAITASGGTATNYAITHANGTLTVGKAALTATADDKLKIYGAADPTLTYTVGGTLFYTDTPAVVSGVSLATETGAAATAGAHVITATGGTAANYTITDFDGTLTVNQAPLTVKASNQSRAYNGVAYSGGNGVTFIGGGFKYTDTVASLGGALGYSGTSQGAIDAGSYTITPGGYTSSNYALTFSNGTLTMTKAPLTVTADNQSKTYGGVDPTLTYTPSGTLYGADGYGVIGGVNLFTPITAAATAGTHPITASGGTATNYAITHVPGTLTVAQAALVVTADNKNKTYGAADPSLTYTPSGTLFYTDTYSVISGVSLATATGAAATAGTHAITATGGTAANYTLTDFGATLTVDPAALTVTANNDTRVYSGVAYNGGNGVMYTGFQYADNAASLGGTLGYSGDSQGATNIGTYTLTPGGYTSGNYTIGYVDGTLTINQASLIVTAINATRTYDATAFSGGNGVTFSGFQNSEDASVLGGTLSYSGTSQGAINAGSYVITPGGYTSSNYTFGYVNGTLTVNKAPLTVTADNQAKTYGGAEPTLTYTPTGTLYGLDTYGVIGGVSLATMTGAAASAGTHTITASNGTATNYAITHVGGTLTVSKAALTATAANKSKVYGTADPALTYTVGGTLFYSDTAAVVSGVGLSTMTLAAATAGTHTITATGGTAANYTITPLNGTLTVSQAPLTVKASNQSRAYNGVAYSGGNGVTFIGGGFQYTDTSASLGGALTYAGTAQGAINVGSYSITPQGYTSSNYALTFSNGTLTMTKAPLTVTANNKSKIYGDIDPTLTYTSTGTLYGSDAYSVISGVNLATATAAAATAGTHAITASGGTATNYAITHVGGTLTVTKAPLTVTADDKSKVYGATNPLLTYTVGGPLYYGNTSSVVSGVSLATMTGAAATAGTHAITATGGTASNYSLTNFPGTLTVSQAALTVTASNDARTYSGLAYSGGNGVLYSAFQYTDNAASLGGTLAYSGNSQGAINAGAYTLTPGGYTSGNYAIGYSNGTLTINQAALTVTANNASRTYDATAFSGGNGVVFAGFQNSENASVLGGTLNYSGTSQGAINAGSYVITPEGYTSGNYTFGYVNGTLTVSQAGLTVTADNQAKTYGGIDPTLTYTPTGTLFGADTFGVISGVSLATATAAVATAGTHTITASGGTATNYAITHANGTLTVGKAGLTATADNKAKTYGAADPTLSYTLGGTLFYGDAPSVVSAVSLATMTGAAATAGTHTITASGGTAANYTITDFNGTLTVNQAPLTVTANNDSKIYNAIAYTGGNGVAFSGFQYADNVASLGGTLGYGGTSQGAINAGSYSITPGGYLSGNYALSYVSGTLTLAQALLLVTADNQTKTYGGLEPTLTYTPSGMLFGADTYAVISGINLSTATGAAASAGTHVITATGGTAANYAVTDANGTLTVNQAPLTVTADAKNKIYGGADPSLTYTVGGPLFYGETASVVSGVSLATMTGGAATAGTHAITAVGGTAANYAITDVNGLLTVNQAPLTITADNQAKTYGGLDPTLTYTPSGSLFYGDAYSVVSGVSLSTPTGAAATGGTHPITTSGGTAANYSLSNVSGTLTVAKAALTVTAINASKSYDAIAYIDGNGVTFAGFQYSEDATSLGAALTYAGTSQGAINAGSYTLIPGGYTSGNYTFGYVDGTLTISQAVLTVTADNQAKTYGGTDPTLTYTAAGTLFGADTFAVISGVSLATSTGATAIAGTHVITATGGTATNYTVTDVNGTLTVGQAPLTFTADDKNKTYGAADPALSFTPSGTLFYGDTYSVVSGVGLATATGATATAGNHAIAVSGGTAANYAVTHLNGVLTVNQAALTLTAANDSKAYDSIAYSGGHGATFSGFQYTDSVVSLGGALSYAGTSQGAINVGSYAITPGGYTSGNYAISFLDGTLIIGQSTLLVTADNQTKTYGGLEPTLTYTPSGTLFGADTYAVITGVSLSTATGATATAGAHVITATGGTAANYAVVDANGTLTVNQAPLTATADAQNKTYGGADPALTYTVGGPLFYGETASVVSGVSLATMTGAAATAGTHAITAAGGTAANYSVTPINGLLTVNQAALTVTADNQGKTYGGAEPALTFTPSGTLFYGDAYNVVSGVGLSTATGSSATAGTHAITPSGGTAANYSVANVNGTLTVAKAAALTVTADNQNKVYGGVDPSLTFSTNGILFYGDTANVVSGVSLATSTGATATAGIHVITTSGGTAANYDITDVNGTLTVAKAPLIVTAENAAKTYDATAFSGGNGVTFAGLQYTDNAASLGGALSFAGTAQGAINAGSYSITPQGYTSGNYTLAYVNGTLTLSQASLAVTANNQSKIYGGLDPALTFLPSGTLYGSDTYSVISGVTLSTATGAAATAGTHPISVSGATAGNYAVAQIDGTLSVGQAPLTVTADNRSKTYGGADPTLTYTPSGTLFYGDAYSVVTGVGLATSTGAAATAGTHAITASGGSAANYAVTSLNGILTVGKAGLTATATDQNKIYGAADPTLTFSVGGPLFYGDTSNAVTGLTLATATSAAATAGTHVISAIGGTAANYTVTPFNGTLTVGQAALTVTADDQSKTYGGADPSLTYSVGGPLFYGDTPNLVSGVILTTETGAAATAGAHIITVRGGTAANYALTDFDGTLTVAKAALSVTADNQNKTYGGTDPALSYSVGGTLFYGDNASVVSGVALMTATGAGATAGTHAIGVTGGIAANYTIAGIGGTLSVAKAPLTVTADPQSKYAGSSFSFNGTEFVTTGLFGSDTLTRIGLTSEGTAGSALPGIYETAMMPDSATGAGVSNYTITFVSSAFTVLTSGFDQFLAGSIVREQINQVIGATFIATYGQEQYYVLEVPGTIHRVVPSTLVGIAAGSSVVNVQLGLETVYTLNRFQSLRH